MNQKVKIWNQEVFYKENKMLLIVFVIIISYLILTYLYGRFEVTDELFFKVAGKNWAEKGHFNAPELIHYSNGSTSGVEKIFFLYVPLYPFFFGVFVKIFGFGWRQCVMYDALIHALLVLITFVITKQIFLYVFNSLQKPLRYYRTILIPPLMVLPLAQFGRPDEMAMVFGMVGLMPILNEIRLNRVAFSSICFGISAGTSTGVAIELGLVAFFLIWFSQGTITEKVYYSLIWLFVFTISLGLVLLPILIKHPFAYQQYLSHANAYMFKWSLQSFKLIFKYGMSYCVILFSVILVAILGLFCNLEIFKIKTLSALWIGGFSAIAFVLFVLPGKYTYFWFVIPILLISSVVSSVILCLKSEKRSINVFVLLIFLFALSAYARSAQNYLILLNLVKKQSIRYNDQKLKQVIPKGAKVIVQSGWWFLGSDYTLFDSMFSNKKDTDDIDYMVLSSVGSGAPAIPHLPWNRKYKNLLLTEFEEIYNNLPAEPNKLFNLPISKSGNGFGLVVYKRIQKIRTNNHD